MSVLKRLPKVTIAEVHDGDTVRLGDGRKVRFIGINTPERQREERAAEPIAEKAYEFLLPWKGQNAYLLVGSDRKDRYGRTLGHLLSSNGDNITAELLKAGMGFTVTIPPNVQFADCYQKMAMAAKNRSSGVWSHHYHRIRTSSMPTDLQGGFGRFRGKIEKIYVSNKVIWVDLFGDISLRVARKDQVYLNGGVLSRLLRAVDEKSVLKLPHIEFSGWLVDRTKWGDKMIKKIKAGKRKRWQMNIRHQNHWQLSNW